MKLTKDFIHNAKLMITPMVLSAVMVGSHFSFAEAEQYQGYEVKATYTHDDANISGSQLTFEYLPQSLYEVNCKTGHIKDIILKPGETIQYIGAGDTAQWMVDNTVVDGTAHVYVKPKLSEITTNLIVNTEYHSYRLVLISTDTYNPIVRWNFAKEEAEIYEDNQREKQKSLHKGTAQTNTFKKLNFNYQIERKKKLEEQFLPVSIYDDGIHTYIKMQNNNKYDLPIIYNVNRENTLTLANYRVCGNLFIVDKVFSHGRIIYTNKASVDFVAHKKAKGE